MAATAEATRTTRTSDGTGQVITIRPAVAVADRLADPAAVGLAGFGLTTLVLSMINVGWVSTAALPVVLGLALAYGGLMQLAAGMWAFVKRDTFAAVALSSYGAFWISFWVLNTFDMKTIPAAEQGNALGLYLIAWGIFTGYMLLASLRVSVAVAAVFATLFPTYILLGLGKSIPSLALFHIGGGFGIATALIAWYVSFAITFNKTAGRDVVPIGHIGGPPGDKQ